MAHYTTQLRHYLETLSGRRESADYGAITEIIDETVNKIFSSVPFYDADVLAKLEKKVLYHFYFREIGMETVALWKYEVNKTLSEIAPHYSKLFESAEITYNPLYDVNYTRTGSQEDEVDRSNVIQTSDTETTTGHDESAGTSKDRFSDTPQNGLSNVENNQYLTTYEAIDTTNERDASSNRTASTQTSDTGGEEKTSNWTETIVGKHGGLSYAKMIQEYRETLLRLEEMFIFEFETCFMQLI